LKRSKPEIFRASENLNRLAKAIDALSKLTSFSFFVQPSKTLFYTEHILPQDCLLFENLFSKLIPLKKLKLIFHQTTVSSTRFFALLESLKGLSLTLEKLWINIGDVKANNDEMKGSKVYAY